jgi:Flp pilus assembly protein TadB
LPVLFGEVAVKQRFFCFDCSLKQGDESMSENVQDPTGEYQRHQRKLRRSRKSTLRYGIVNVIIGLLGLLFSLAILGYLLWTHVTAWLSYTMIGCLLVYCVLWSFLGWQRIRLGKQVVTQQEVQQAKQQHRRTLQESVRGELPDTFSKSTRYIYLGCALLFGVLATATWYSYIVLHAGGALGYAIGHTIAMAFALLGFLVSLMGKAHQQGSAAELRRILQAGEFIEPSNEQLPGE